MEIQRINEYADERFDPGILRQHGAFLVDGHPCSFRILDGRSAQVYYHDYTDMEEILDTFRFYTGHISRFYRSDGSMLKEYEDVEVFLFLLRSVFSLRTRLYGAYFFCLGRFALFAKNNNS